MHLSEGILPISHAALWGAVGVLAVIAATRHAAPPEGERIPRGMASALLFAVTLLPIPVPVAGATSHMCATPLLALLLGWRAVVVPTAVVLLLQALFFAHGGITTLGANVVTLGVVGPLVAVAVNRMLRRAPDWAAIGVACALGDAAVYVTDAAVLGLALPGAFGHTFVRVLAGFAPVQLPLAVFEGVASMFLVRALARRRPELVRLALPVVLALLLVPASARAADWVGLDEGVMGRIAAEAGQSSGPFIELPGDLSLTATLGAGLLCGFVLGRAWTRLGSPGRG